MDFEIVCKHKKILVCGGRDFADKDFVWDVLRQVEPSFIVTGGQGKNRRNRGADALAEKFALAHKIPHDVVHADWDRLGRSAGPRRNRQMLRSHPDIAWVIAFPGGVGTSDMIGEARKANIVVLEFEEGDLDELYRVKPSK